MKKLLYVGHSYHNKTKSSQFIQDLFKEKYEVTMNEYIQDGINGYLYDLDNPSKINFNNIKEIQKKTVEYIETGYKTWKENKYKILDWIESDVTKNRNDKLIKKKLMQYEIQKKKIKISITYLKKKITPKHKIYYLFGFLPIYKKKRG